MSHSVNSILTQIRSYQTQASGIAIEPAIDAPAGNALGIPRSEQNTNQPSFTEALRGALNSVNNAQHEAGKLAHAFEIGDPSADLAKVMVAAQQSQVAFKATVEVRNRLVQAYQDVMNMPL